VKDTSTSTDVGAVAGVGYPKHLFVREYIRLVDSLHTGTKIIEVTNLVKELKQLAD
jgi:hypothetical protein